MHEKDFPTLRIGSRVVVPKEKFIQWVEEKEMKILRQEDISTYLKAADARGVLPMFFLELTSGLRKGELVALLWSDLYVEHKALSVSKQAIRAEGGEIKVTRPKTATSIRKISIPQEAVDLLVQEHDKHPDNPYMFPSPKTGGMWFPDSVVNLHAKILKDAGLEHIRFHDLRHPYVKHTTKIFSLRLKFFQAQPVPDALRKTR
ncbi:MAG: site-specific integrase, partial [Ruminococcaceae bacterium]|nr:site-specific integrase [Oscillospiraceae bacterium]